MSILYRKNKIIFNITYLNKIEEERESIAHTRYHNYYIHAIKSNKNLLEVYIFLSCEQSLSMYLSEHVKRTLSCVESSRNFEYKSSISDVN